LVIVSKKDTAESLMSSNRVQLRKFESLHLNGKSLTGYSIGGYQINVANTEAVVKKLAPIPPSALPKIFIDDDLNFFHHFFKGIESLLGSQLFTSIINSRHHYESEECDIPKAIAGFMQDSFKAGDNALTLLVKKVLSSTFEESSIEEETQSIVVLRVVTNLWGFRYIEPGMLLKSADVKMWLSTCRDYYRTLWFDTFKSSGIPEFATEGVILNHTRPAIKITSMELELRPESNDLIPYKRRTSSHNQTGDRHHRSSRSGRTSSWLSRTTQ